jgi:gliding motility-associated-like protein
VQASVKTLATIVLLLFTVIISFGQAPDINYATPPVFTIGNAINVLKPTNTGGAVPANAYGGVSTLAGSGFIGNVNGQGAVASFHAPVSVITDITGNVYVADSQNHQVRKITPAGEVSVFAGDGSQGNVDGKGIAARFSNPVYVSKDAAGNLYVGDGVNSSIRKITMAADVSSAATGIYQPYGVAADALGNLFISQPFNHVILKITPGGVKTTFAGSGNRGALDGKGTAASFNGPTGLVADAAGNLYVADGGNSTIRKIAPDGTVSTFAGNKSAIGAIDGKGLNASFNFPNGLTIDVLGNIYVADTGNNLIRRITPDGVVTTVAGSSSGKVNDIGKKAKFFAPLGVAVDALGNLFVADQGNNIIRKIQVTGYSINKPLPAGLSFDPATGAISGTPAEVSALTKYIVTAYNLSGESGFPLMIEVRANALPPAVSAPDISYSTPNVYKKGALIVPLKPVNKGGDVPATIYGETTVFAGTGRNGTADGDGAQAQFTEPYGMTTDAEGNIYLADADNYRIRKITPEGKVSTLAPDGIPGGPNFDSPKFNLPHDLVRDAAGNLYVANYARHNILKITPDGTITVFAGGLLIGRPKDGQGTAASIVNPNAIAMDATGTLYVSDGSNLIRKISPAGYVYTFVGSGKAATADGKYNTASFNQPAGMVVDAAGNLYVAEQKGNVIRKVSPFGDVTTVAGSGTFGSADGTGPAAKFAYPTGITIDKSGNLYVTDWGNGTIRKITPDQVVTTIAGGGPRGTQSGVGTDVYFNSPSGITMGPDGNLIVSEFDGNYLKKIITTGYIIDKALPAGLVFDPKTGIITGTPTVLWPATDYKVTAYNAGGSSSFILNIEVKTDVIVAPPKITYTTPNVYTVNKVIPALAPKNTGGPVPATIYGQVTTFAGGGKGDYFNSPTRLAQDATGNLYLADRDNNLIKKITPEGVVTVFASGFNQPNGVTVDSKGNIFVADAASNQIKKITPDGTVSVFAGSGSAGKVNGSAGTASFYYPYSVVADKDDNLYVADSQNNLIRKVTPAGDVSTLAGSGSTSFSDGDGILASFYSPTAVNMDADGNIYVADPYNYRVRKITPAGAVTTIAGSGQAGSDNGAALLATFNVPAGVAVDAAGDIYVADISNNLIRKIDAQGVVTTLAGSGDSGAVDGVGALATFSRPNDVQVNSAGFLYITDYGNSLVRKVVVTGYTIDKALPDGLTFDPTTGIITGTPTVTWPATDYLVTAYNVGGSSSFVVNIKVTELGGGISASAVTGNISNCENVISTSYQQFTALGTQLSENIKVTPPAGFLVSASPAAGYDKVLYLIVSGDKVNPIKIYVKLDDKAVAGNYTGDVVLSSAGVANVLAPVSGRVFKTPSVNAVPTPAPYCNGESITPITFSGTADSYSWTNSNTGIGLAASGTGDISFAAKNNSANPITSTITVTPIASSGVCSGVPVSFTITVNPSLVPTISISQVNVTCVGQLVSFKAAVDNAGVNPIYQWQVNGANAGSNNPVFNSSTLQANDAVTCMVTSTSVPCSAPALSNTLKVFYKPDDAPPIVSIDKAGDVSGCVGTDFSFIAIAVKEGINPTYQWLLNGLPVPNNTGKTYTSNTLVNGDQITCAVINNDGCTPVVSPVSAPVNIVIAPSQQISTVVINSSLNMPVCAASTLTFTPTPANYQTAAGVPTYVWYLNGAPVSSNDTYTTNTLTDGDEVYCIMTTYDKCVVPAPVQSNTIKILVKQDILPTVSINPNGEISSCPGSELSFTATTTNGGINPTYQWMVNGQLVNNPGKVYNTTSLVTGDKVTCKVINNDGCTPVASPVSAPANIIITPVQVSTVTISSSVAMPVCATTAVTFTPLPVNYQTINGLPTYVWYLNGAPVGSNNSYTTNTLADGDKVYCLMTTYGKCVAPAPVQSNIIKVLVKPVVSPTVSINPNGAISTCSGAALSFTATTANAGSNPTYKWMVNGQQINNPGSVYASSVLAGGDKVTCVVVNNDGCTPVASPVSEAADIIADPVQVSTVTVAASVPMPVCQGKEITFIPTPANYQTGSGAPTYLWYVNGALVSNNDTYTSKMLADGDQVYCIMTTYGKCVAPVPAQSNIINVNLAPEVGCIVVPIIVIPNAFTPNGDGHNDTWNIPALANYPGCIVNVFNRYGISVFRSINYTSAWNGNYSDGVVPSGTYYYIIEPKKGQAKLSGYVVVIR